MTSAIREGDSVRVEWGENRELQGSVIRVSGTWIVLRPDEHQLDETPLRQDRLVVHWPGNPGQSSAAGLWRSLKGPDYTLQLQSDELPSQRRSHFRTSIRLSLAVQQNSVHKIFVLEDLSGGGCRCGIDSDDEFVEGEEYTGSLNLDDGNPPLKLDLTVVRVEPSAVAFYFAIIGEKDRQRILQTLFREYRAKRAATRSTSDADPSVSATE